MKIDIKIKGSAGHGFTITPAIHEYVTKRCESFAKFLQHDPNALVTVELSKLTEHQKSGDIFSAEVHILAKIGGKSSDLYSSAERSDLYAAIDAVKDEAFEELSSTKAKNTTLDRKAGAEVKNILKGIK